MKKQTAYKVVCLLNDRFESFFNDHSFSLKYEIGKETIPKIGKIFVFESLESSLYFLGVNYVHKYEPLYILQGIAVNTKRIYRACSDHRDFEEFWIKKKNKRKVSSFYSDKKGVSLSFRPNPGSLVCDSFTPEKIVN